MKNIINKAKRLLLTIMPKDRWLSTKNKVISTLWQCFLSASAIFYASGTLSIQKDTFLAFLSAFTGALLSAIKNIIKEYKASNISADELEKFAVINGGQNEVK
jgi:hypothetical protein